MEKMSSAYDSVLYKTFGVAWKITPRFVQSIIFVYVLEVLGLGWAITGPLLGRGRGGTGQTCIWVTLVVSAVSGDSWAGGASNMIHI